MAEAKHTPRVAEGGPYAGNIIRQARKTYACDQMVSWAPRPSPMADSSTITGWVEYAGREGAETAIAKLFEIVDQERSNADRAHRLYREARDALWTAQYVEGDADLLNAIADEIDCGDGCDCASQEPDTGTWNCSRDDAEGIGCRGAAAAQLRQMSATLKALAELRKPKPEETSNG